MKEKKIDIPFSNIFLNKSISWKSAILENLQKAVTTNKDKDIKRCYQNILELTPNNKKLPEYTKYREFIRKHQNRTITNTHLEEFYNLSNKKRRSSPRHTNITNTENYKGRQRDKNWESLRDAEKILLDIITKKYNPLTSLGQDMFNTITGDIFLGYIIGVDADDIKMGVDVSMIDKEVLSTLKKDIGLLYNVYKEFLNKYHEAKSSGNKFFLNLAHEIFYEAFEVSYFKADKSKGRTISTKSINSYIKATRKYIETGERPEGSFYNRHKPAYICWLAGLVYLIFIYPHELEERFEKEREKAINTICALMTRYAITPYELAHYYPSPFKGLLGIPSK